MSGDPEQDYFADGMVEDIITGLSRFKWLFVIARNSTFTYKGQAGRLKQIARELGVRYVLEGSVRKAGESCSHHRAAHRRDQPARTLGRALRPLARRIFALQDEITMSVVGAIEPSLRKAEIDRVKRQRPNNLDAYDLVLRSLPYVYARIPKDVATAIPLLVDALKLEPDYGAAHAYYGLVPPPRFSRGGFAKEDRIAAIQSCSRGDCARQ